MVVFGTPVRSAIVALLSSTSQKVMTCSRRASVVSFRAFVSLRTFLSVVFVLFVFAGILLSLLPSVDHAWPRILNRTVKTFPSLSPYDCPKSNNRSISNLMAYIFHFCERFLKSSLARSCESCCKSGCDYDDHPYHSWYILALAFHSSVIVYTLPFYSLFGELCS